MASVALAPGINAELAHPWRRIEREREVAREAALEAGFVALPAGIAPPNGSVMTLVRDHYKGYEPVLKPGARSEAAGLVRARRKFEESFKNGQTSLVADEAIRHRAWILTG